MQINVTHLSRDLRFQVLSIIERKHLTDVPCVAGIPVAEVSIHDVFVNCVIGASKGVSESSSYDIWFSIP